MCLPDDGALPPAAQPWGQTQLCCTGEGGPKLGRSFNHEGYLKSGLGGSPQMAGFETLWASAYDFEDLAQRAYAHVPPAIQSEVPRTSSSGLSPLSCWSMFSWRKCAPCKQP